MTWMSDIWMMHQWEPVTQSAKGKSEWRRGRKEGGTRPGGPLQRNLSAEKREWEQGKGRQQPGFYANVAFPENLKKKMWINVKSWAVINNWSHCPVRCHQTIAEKDGTARWCNAPVKPQNNVENTMEIWRLCLTLRKVPVCSSFHTDLKLSSHQWRLDSCCLSHVRHDSPVSYNSPSLF